MKEYMQPSMEARMMRIKAQLLAGSTPAGKVDNTKSNLTGDDAIKVNTTPSAAPTLPSGFFEGR